MENDKQSFWEIIHNLTKRHWIIYTIIISLPTIWFTLFATVFGDQLNIKCEDGTFSIGGRIISVAVVLITLVIVAINNKYASKSEFGKLERLKGNITYLKKISSSVDNICDEKYAQIRRTIVH